MKKSTLLTIILALCIAAQLSAQKRLIIADVETLLPISGANAVGKGTTAISDSTGLVVLPDSCRSLLFSHVNYESRLINTEEVGDTIFLISKLLNLQEVVVFGKGKHTDQLKQLRERLKISKTEAELLAADPSAGVNLLTLIGSILPKKWKKNSKKARQERIKKILDEY
jgi:hypothetical protein